MALTFSVKQEGRASIDSDVKGGRVRFMTVRCLAETMVSVREYGGSYYHYY